VQVREAMLGELSPGMRECVARPIHAEQVHGVDEQRARPCPVSSALYMYVDFNAMYHDHMPKTVLSMPPLAEGLQYRPFASRMH
jgi:hypothetical protein